MIRGDKGQLTIFIIMGVILVVSVGIFFLFRTGMIPTIGGGKEINSDAFLYDCLEEKIKQADEIISLRGGNIETPSFYIPFKFDKENIARNISYLCYTSNYYVPCVNRYPILLNHLEEEIENYISEDVKICFDELVSSLERQNYEVKKTYLGFDLNLVPDKILVEIDAEMTLTKTDETSKKTNFNVIVKSKLYDLVNIAKEIVNQEAEFCYFENNGFMLLYPEYKISKIRKKYSLIYTILDKETLKEFRFAIRGCVSRAGF